MIKVTEKGIETLGTPRELSEEELEFINDMFEDFSNHQKFIMDKPDRECDD